MEIDRSKVTSPKDLQYWKSYDNYTLDNPHVGDPRSLQMTQRLYCFIRYTMFCRCCRELGEDDPRCKYQYYRAEVACTQDFLDLVNQHREAGTCGMDLLPGDRIVGTR
ncbi:hypothetical protein BEWA_001390 [Theileria equi strain WA]|uniref:Uncharacterized protein n=1 Tax=Theileria equi strain WA TaxID=1537102 RepID=L0AYR1_THEEQ|nr:hypothetical protein BEWA_001390 [Theileria equi strain WA]AFZ80732.1 hypothetical protein BEWA_001390 [Theileria equi strain WA]|eukprot:XP_004830398.1 hypothetical protein BEWA_001390 [Theileria equi strain WA]